MSCLRSLDQAVLVLREVAPNRFRSLGSVRPSRYRVSSKAKPGPRVATVRTFSVWWKVALSLVEAAYFRSRRLAPMCFIRGSSEADALRSRVQVPLKFGL